MLDDLARSTLDVVHRFNDAFNRHDVDAVMALMTANCVFENTVPPPDGERFVGASQVRGFWERFFAATLHARFETEEIFTAGGTVQMPRVPGIWTISATLGLTNRAQFPAHKAYAGAGTTCALPG